MNLPILLDKTPDGRHLIRLNNSWYGGDQSQCMRASYYQLLAGLHDSTLDKDNRVQYGTAAHKAWQLWAMGVDIDKCIQAGMDHLATIEHGDDWRHSTHLEAMLLRWFGEFGEARPKFVVVPEVAPELIIDANQFIVGAYNGKSAKPLIEYQWQFPIYEDSFAVVMLQGTIDLVHLVEGKVRVRDYKTTADREPETKLEQLLTSTQFLTYALAMDKCLGIKDAEYEIEGVFLRKDNKNIFQRSRILSFENEEGQRRLRQHEKNLYEFAKGLRIGLINAEINEESPLDHFPEDYRFCHSGWGCPYLGITNAIDEHKEMFISSEFERKVFNAHKHHEN